MPNGPGPVEIVVDCRTQQEIAMPASQEVLDEQQQLADAAAAAAQAAAQAEQQRQQAIEVVKAEAASNPAFTALLTLLDVNSSAATNTNAGPTA